jgi:ribosomal protein L29
MRLNPRQIAELRAECGKGGLDAALLAAQLLEMVEKLQAQLAASESMLVNARRDIARVEAELVEQRLSQASCPSCHDAQARAVLERLRAVAAAP